MGKGEGMKAYEGSDVVGVVSVVLGLLLSVGVLLSSAQIKQNNDTNQDVTTDVVVRYLEPLMYAESIDLLAEQITKFTPSTALYAVKYLCGPHSSLKDVQKAELIVSLIHVYLRDDRDVPTAIMEWVFSQKSFVEQYPLLYVAATSMHGPAIDELLAWANNESERRAIRRMIGATLAKVLDDNNVEALEKLLAHGVRLSLQQATKFLELVVQRGKNPLFVGHLSKYHADLDHEVGNKTMLMIAVERGDKPMVEALLKAGADVNIMTDPAIGTAQQIAFEHGNYEIEQLIGKYTATAQVHE